jgi:hypothetical protein
MRRRRLRNVTHGRVCRQGKRVVSPPPEGISSAGWDTLRQSRHRRMIDLGIVDRKWPLTSRDPRVTSSADVPYKEWHERRMEVYAAQIASLDRAVGEIVAQLETLAQRENTLVIFLSDNGGCAEEIGAQWKGRHISSKRRKILRNSGPRLWTDCRLFMIIGPTGLVWVPGMSFGQSSHLPTSCGVGHYLPLSSGGIYQ